MDGIMRYKGNRIRCQQLPVLDPLQEIDAMESYVSFVEHQLYLSASMQNVFCVK